MYSFGCPGHGKGPWDGIGGTEKAAVATAVKHSQISGRKISGLDKCEIHNALDVYKVLKATFDTDDWRAEQKRKKAPLAHMHFLYSSEEFKKLPCGCDVCKAVSPSNNFHPTISRPSKPETFRRLEGISSMYEFKVVGHGILDCRTRACWCVSCMHHTLESSDRHNSPSFVVPGCTSADLTEGPYALRRCGCPKTSGMGSTKDLPFVSNELKEVAAGITEGDWVVFKDGELDEGESTVGADSLWVGRAVVNTAAAWNGKATHVNRSRKKLGVLDPGDVGVMVQWYTLHSANATHVDYVLSQEYPVPVVTNLDTVIGVFKSGHASDVFHQHDSPMESTHRTRKRNGLGTIGSSCKSKVTLGPYEPVKTAEYRKTEAEELASKGGNIWRMTKEHYDLLQEREDLSVVSTV